MTTLPPRARRAFGAPSALLTLLLAFAAGLVAGHSGAPLRAAASECDASRPEWLMCEDFEDGHLGWRDWFAASPFTECIGCRPDGTNNPDRIRLADDPGAAYSGDWAVHMPAAAAAGFQGGALTYRSCDGPKRAGCNLVGHERLHFRTRVRLADDHAYVHHFLSIDGTRPNGYWEADGNAGCRPNGLRAAGTTLDFNGDRELFFYTYFPDMRCDTGGYCSGDRVRDICALCATKEMPCSRGPECCWGNLFAPGPAVVLPRGRWVCLELMMELNTPGQADGRMAFWIDGLKAHEVTGMRFRDLPELQLNKAWLQHYVAGGDAEHSNQVWFDDMIVSTDYIGCAGPVATEAAQTTSTPEMATPPPPGTSPAPTTPPVPTVPPPSATRTLDRRVHLPVLMLRVGPNLPTPLPAPSGAPATANPTLAATPGTAPSPTPTSTPPLPDFAPFGLVRLAPDLLLEGSGTTIDSLAFWEAPVPADSLLLVTAKGNQRVEVWRQPFEGQELPALQHPSFGTGTQVNGIVVDQDLDRVYIAVSRPASTVAVFALPGLAFLGELVEGAVDLRSEPNLALLTLPDGAKRLYVSADDRVYAYDPESSAALGGFAPGLSFETILADDVDQVLYIPDETRRSGIYAFHPDGTPFSRGGEAHFGGQGVFEADAEGIALYACLTPDGSDDGRGLLIVSDQKPDASDFEIFDRRSWAHLGRLQLDGVRFTDGIASTRQPLPGHPAGLFAAVNNDTNVALIGWERILKAAGLRCQGEL